MMGMLSAVAMLVALSGGQIGLPLGLPPLAEDPVLANIAPEECLVYYSWSGVAEPDPKSKNQTEQLLAEPEVQQFVTGLGRALAAAIRKGAPATPQGQVLGKYGPSLIHMLLTHPVAIFASKLDAAANGTDVAGGIVVATGNKTAEIRVSLDEIEKVLLAGESHAGSAKWHVMPAARVTSPVEWGFRGQYLIVGFGPGSADAIARRLNGKPPSWLDAIKKRLPVPRVSTVLYINVKSMGINGAPAPGESELRPFLSNFLELTNITAVATVSGLDSTRYVSKTWFQTAKAPTGLLSVFGGKPLTSADLAPIPKDASFGLVARLDSTRVYESAVKLWQRLFPDLAQSVGGDTRSAEALLGIRFKEDIFDALGDSWCLYNSPGEGGLLITGLTLVVPVKDAGRLRKATDRLVQLAGDSGLTAGPFVKPTTFRRQKIFVLNSLGFPLPLPFSLAWCVSDTHLIVSLTPQNIRAFLSRDPKASSLADVPAVAEKLKSDQPVLLTYHDTAAVLKVVYPVLQMFAGSMAMSLQQEGLDVDASLLPSLASILRHVEPGVGTLTVESDGLTYVTRQSLPIGVTLPAVGLWLGSSLAMGPAVFPTSELQPVRFQNIDGIISERTIGVEPFQRVRDR
jgi:hypothetical protein